MSFSKILPKCLICLWEKNLKITEKKQLMHIVENITEGIAVYDLSGRIISVNRGAAKILQLKQKELIGRSYKNRKWKIITLNGKPYPKEKLPVARVLRTRKSVEDIEYIFRRPNGIEIILSENAAPLRDERGDLIGVVTNFTDITKHRKTEEILEKEKNKARRWLDIAGVMLVVIGADQKVSLINKKGCKVLGYKEKEVIGKNWFDNFIPKRVRHGAKAVFKKLMAGKIKPVRYFENPIVTKRGEEKIIAWHNTVLKNKKGKIIGTLSSGEDITKLKQSEQALLDAFSKSQQRESEVSALLKSAEAVLKYQNFEDSARAIFNSCKELTGASAGYIALLSSDGAENELVFLEAGGLPCNVDSSLPMPIRGLRAEAYRFAKVVYHNDFSRSKWAKLLPGGHVELKNVLFAPLVIEGKAVGLMGMANKPGGFNKNDIRIASAFAEIVALSLYNSRLINSLKDSEEHFRSVAKSATDAIISIDSCGKIIFWNKAAGTIFGYSADEVSGKTLALIIPKGLRRAHIQGVKRFVLSKKSKIIGTTRELVGLRKDGNKFPVELSLSSWEIGDQVFFTGIIRDITERKQAEQERDRLIKRTEREWQRTEGLTKTLKMERDTLQVIMENTNAHIAFLDPQFNFIIANSTYAEGSGHSISELIGRNHFELFPNAENQAIFEKVRDTGKAIEFRAKPFEFVDQPWRGVTYWDWTLAPIKDETGKVLGLVLSLIDVTEDTRKKQLDAAFDAINVEIHSTLDLETRMQQCINGSTQVLGAESAFILMYEEPEWIVKYPYGSGKEIVGKRFKIEELKSLEMVTKIKDAVVSNDTYKDKRFNIPLKKRYKIRSLLSVPLIIGAEVIGSLSYMYHSAPITFRAEQIDFAKKLGVTVSLALANSQLYHAQHHIAEILQESLIRSVPKIKGLDIAVAYKTAFEAGRVGGDFYDIFTIDDRLVAVLIGDVAGKGVEAAGITEMVRSSIRSFSHVNSSPSYILTKTNEVLLPQIGLEDFVTASLLILDLGSGEAKFANAGHPLPILCGNGLEVLWVPAGTPLGLFAQDYEESQVKIRQGEVIVFYTDGLTEVSKGSKFFSEKGAIRVLSKKVNREPEEVVNSLLESANKFTDGKLKDDIAIMAIRLSSKNK